MVQVEIPKETLDWFARDELRSRVFYEKYSLKDKFGKPTEKTPEEMFDRVSKEIASVEKTEELRKQWADNFHWLLEGFRFIPGGRILFAAGQTRKSTAINCYVIPIKEDSIEAIFDWCKEAARTYSYGGGVGGDISILRPKGSPVNNSAIYSTGSISFMQLMSDTTGTIGQSGRRGALMISIDISHPDVEDFIVIKKDKSKVNCANISVKITDDFMKAVERDEEFELHFENEKVNFKRRIKAKELWLGLIKSAWESSEPGVLFWDTAKRMSTTEYNGMNILTTNPCGEQFLDPYNCCCLGSINLSAFVKNPFEDSTSIDWPLLEQTVEYAIRFLDNVLDWNATKHPLPQQKEASLRSRRIGVSTTGLGDALIKLGLKYDTEEAIKFVDGLFERIKNRAYQTSICLAREKGSFPAFDVEKHLAQPFIKTLPEFIQNMIRNDGLRNCALQTVAPVGSGSILAGTSSGIEPVFDFSYKRRSHSLSQGEFTVIHPLMKEYLEKNGFDSDQKAGQTLPDYFITAHHIDPIMRVKMQAAIQRHIDNAVSSTTNLPQNISLEAVEKIYFEAWRMGLKGITIYREGSREGILETTKVIKEAPEAQPMESHEEESSSNNGQFTPPAPDEDDEGFIRPRLMSGTTIKMKLVEGSLYLTANRNGNIKEVFITLGRHGSAAKAEAEALGRIISLYLQSGGDVRRVITSLRGIKSASVSWDNGIKLESIPDTVSKALEIIVNGGKPVTNPAPFKGEMCPDCKEQTLIEEGGCNICKNCGYSQCG